MKKTTISIDLFKRGVMFFVGSQDELMQEFDGDEKAQRILREALLDYDDNTNAMTINLGTDAIIYAHVEPSEATLAHEAFHAANMLMKIIGAEYIENDEPCAYLVEQLFDEMQNSISSDVSRQRSSLDVSRHTA